MHNNFTKTNHSKGVQSNCLRRDTTSFRVSDAIISVTHEPCQAELHRTSNKNEKIPNLQRQLTLRRKILTEKVKEDKLKSYAIHGIRRLKILFKDIARRRKEDPLVINTPYGEAKAYFDTRSNKIKVVYGEFADYLAIQYIDSATGKHTVARVPRVSLGATRDMDFYVAGHKGKDTADNYKLRTYRKHLHHTDRGNLYIQGFYRGIRSATRYDRKQLASFCAGNPVVIAIDGSSTARHTVLLDRGKLVTKCQTNYYSPQDDEDFVASGHLVISPNNAFGKYKAGDVCCVVLEETLRLLVAKANNPAQKIYISTDGVSGGNMAMFISIARKFPQVRIVIDSLPDVSFRGKKIHGGVFRLIESRTGIAAQLSGGIAQQGYAEAAGQAFKDAVPKMVRNLIQTAAASQLFFMERNGIAHEHRMEQPDAEIPDFGCAHEWDNLFGHREFFSRDKIKVPGQEAAPVVPVVPEPDPVPEPEPEPEPEPDPWPSTQYDLGIKKLETLASEMRKYREKLDRECDELEAEPVYNSSGSIMQSLLAKLRINSGERAG